MSRSKMDAPPCCPFGIFSLESNLEWKACTFNNLYPRDILMIFGVHIYIRSRWCVAFQNGCFRLLPFELSPMNELYRGKLVRSITLIPLEIFDDIWYAFILGQDDMSHARMVAPPCYPFQLSSYEL